MGIIDSVRTRSRRAGRRAFILLGAVALMAGLAPTMALAQDDPRIGLGAGWLNAEQAASNMELTGHQDRPDGFFSPTSPGNLSFANSDLAFWGDYVAVGNFHGFNIYSIADPAVPVLVTSVVCPGGQGDLAVYGNLLFMSVEETRGRVDCGTQGVGSGAQADRFRGVRIFDISDVTNPVQYAGIQSCKGSHTYSLVDDVDDPDHVYVYISGTAGIRNAAEAPGGCTGASSLVDPNTDNFSISVSKVPLADPGAHVLVNRNARVMSTCGDNSCQDDHANGSLNGLPGSGVQPTYPAGDPRAPGGQSRSQTSQCHDITAYAAIGLAAGACQGHGILLDISNPEMPRRIDAVEDWNFAYWHSATFSNDGSKVIFTDEWGGGTAARCRPQDNMNWGADAMFNIVETDTGLKMEFAGYYKLPVTQTNQENCVAHNGSLVPVPGRDIFVQAWYQGGLSVWDFSDPTNPFEIAFFDRGPMSATALQASGFWSTYYYNGYIYGSEIGRGIDAFRLLPSEYLSEYEIAAAAEVAFDALNVQTQPEIVWAPSVNVVGSYRDQAERAGAISAAELLRVDEFLAAADGAETARQMRTAANQGYHVADRLNPATQADLIDAITALSDDLDAQTRG